VEVCIRRSLAFWIQLIYAPDNPDLPASNLTLKYVAIGRGVQNYTCTGFNSTAATDGAVATLYDATDLARTNLDLLNTLPAQVVNVPVDQAGQSQNLPVLGHHFFRADLVPSFVLDNGDAIYAAKTDDVKPPPDASTGPAGTAAVDWLQLTAKVGYVLPSVGLGQVYRVVTAGGSATTCQSAGIISVPYAAEYWFYGWASYLDPINKPKNTKTSHAPWKQNRGWRD
jgi:hypothetical protein